MLCRLVSGQCGVPQWPGTTRLSVGTRSLRQSYITPHCPQCPPVSRRLLLWQPPLRALRVKATGFMQNCLRWVRSHSCRRSPVAFAPYAPPAGSLVVVVALWHWSGAARIALVSGLRPVMLCAPPTPGLAAARHWPWRWSARPPPGGSLSPAPRVMKRVGFRICYRIHSCLRIFCEGYRPKRPVSQRAAGLLVLALHVCAPLLQDSVNRLTSAVT
jgi:hypothetical protein